MTAREMMLIQQNKIKEDKKNAEAQHLQMLIDVVCFHVKYYTCWVPYEKDEFYSIVRKGNLEMLKHWVQHVKIDVEKIKVEIVEQKRLYELIMNWKEKTGSKELDRYANFKDASISGFQGIIDRYINITDKWKDFNEIIRKNREAERAKRDCQISLEQGKAVGCILMDEILQ